MQEWVKALAASGLAPATVRHAYRAVFTSVLNDAIDDGLLARSPCHRIELPAAVLPAIEPLTPAQILTLASLIDPRYLAMVWLAAGCGLRWSEAAGLTRDRIHLGARAQVTIDRQVGYRPATTRHSPDTGSRRLGHAHPGEIRWYRHPPRPRGRPGHARRYRRRPHRSGNRPRAGSSVLTLLTEKLTSPEPGTGQHGALSQVTRHGRVRRQGLEPRTRG